MSTANSEESSKRVRCVALLSGGLDSTLAVKLMKDIGVEVKALAIKTPFCDFDCGKGCGFRVKEVADSLGVDLKTVYLGEEYIEMLKSPKYGYGSGMNPCIDCRVMMYRVAREYMEECGADFIVTGEVLNQRPMSQNMRALRIIEKESNLEGKVLRPLSAKQLKPTEAELRGLVKRDMLLGIRGRSRKVQMGLAKQLGLDAPNAAGGCLLTDRQFARRVKDLLEYVHNPTLNDIELLKVGRHFRLSKDAKLVVGRNKDENEIIQSLMQDGDIMLEARDAKGPKALLRRNKDDIGEGIVSLAASIVCRYSDADGPCIIIMSDNITTKEIKSEPIASEMLESYRI
ncbi:MAG: tRNA (5-methylaminomethyl-2-thiouridylate)-methyltransferase [Candidatus Nitrosocaldus sp.]